jgi:hypothetical protein
VLVIAKSASQAVVYVGLLGPKPLFYLTFYLLAFESWARELAIRLRRDGIRSHQIVLESRVSEAKVCSPSFAQDHHP